MLEDAIGRGVKYTRYVQLPTRNTTVVELFDKDSLYLKHFRRLLKQNLPENDARIYKISSNLGVCTTTFTIVDDTHMIWQVNRATGGKPDLSGALFVEGFDKASLRGFKEDVESAALQFRDNLKLEELNQPSTALGDGST